MSYKFCRLYHLIHLTSIGDAAALLWSNGYCHMISGGGWWEWGNIQCTVGAYSWPGDEWIDPLCWKGRIAQPPHSAHKWAPFVFLTKLFFFMKCKVQTPSLMWRNKRVYFVLTRKNHGKIKAFIYNFMHDEVLWVRICNDERDNTRTNENVLTEFFAPSLSIYNWHQMNKIQ